MTPLLGHTEADLVALAKSEGLPGFVGKQIAHWLYKAHVSEISEMTNVSLAARSRLAERYCVGAMPHTAAQQSADGTAKYLFPVRTSRSSTTRDAGAEAPQTPQAEACDTHSARVESVFIPDGERGTLCVSCQVGCKMGCRFCHTGQQGWHGDLTAGDIVNQIHSLPERERLTNIVFMGQGEPMDNLDAVLGAIEVLTAPWGYGWSPHRITVSTVGASRDAIERFLSACDCHLAVSLHTPLHEQRAKLMPAERATAIADIITMLRGYDWTHQRRLSFEYIVLTGVNDTPRHIQALLRLLRGLHCRVNLIRFHKIPGSPFATTDERALMHLRDTLTAHGIYTTIRASRGEDILAACGLLNTAVSQDN